MDDTYAALTRMLTPALPRGPHIFLTILLAYGVVASRLGPCEQLLPYGKVATSSMKPPRSKLRGITRKGIVCETPRFLTLFPLQGNLEASSEESPD